MKVLFFKKTFLGGKMWNIFKLFIGFLRPTKVTLADGYEYDIFLEQRLNTFS